MKQSLNMTLLAIMAVTAFMTHSAEPAPPLVEISKPLKGSLMATVGYYPTQIEESYLKLVTEKPVNLTAMKLPRPEGISDEDWKKFAGTEEEPKARPNMIPNKKYNPGWSGR